VQHGGRTTRVAWLWVVCRCSLLHSGLTAAPADPDDVVRSDAQHEEGSHVVDAHRRRRTHSQARATHTDHHSRRCRRRRAKRAVCCRRRCRRRRRHDKRAGRGTAQRLTMTPNNHFFAAAPPNPRENHGRAPVLDPGRENTAGVRILSRIDPALAASGATADIFEVRKHGVCVRSNRSDWACELFQFYNTCIRFPNANGSLHM
jgi:hypothetical protein